MWHWDQGRLEYFQFDALRQIAAYVVENDFRTASKEVLVQKYWSKICSTINSYALEKLFPHFKVNVVSKRGK